MKPKLLVLCLVILLGAAQGSAFAKFTAAVLPFEGTEIRDFGRDQVIKGITESLTDRLSECDWLKVIERTRMEQILTEQHFGYSGRVDTFTAAEIGRLLGADVLVLGTVNVLEQKEGGGVKAGLVILRGSTARVELSARLVDVNTGVILGSVQGSGTETGLSFAVEDFYGISFSSQAFKDSLLGKALAEAVEDLAASFDDAFRDLELDTEPLVGNILAVVGDKYVLNLGAVHNVKRGDRFAVSQVVRVAGLTKPVEVPVGTLRAISVEEEAFPNGANRP